MAHFNLEKTKDMLARWIAFSQKHLYNCPEREGLTVYGEGEHGHWGVHTHQKAFSAFAVMAADEGFDWTPYGLTRETVLKEALGMLRYNLDTHLTGDFVCTDGAKWGHNWIYTLGIERMAHGLEALEPWLEEEDHRKIRAMLESEADFLLDEYEIHAAIDAHTGFNRPESNIWNGATLYRTAYMYPDTKRRDAYLEKAQRFFAAGLSMEKDENSDELFDGRRMGDLFTGANLTNAIGCNHHGYMNVGYLYISLSNIAMLHFSLKNMGVRADDIIYLNLKPVWEFCRTATFNDGRMYRVGGDSRARYCYCQDYMIPAWPLIEDVFGDDCSELEQGWLELVSKEFEINGDGSFLANRFGYFEPYSPVYYTRLESDRANTFSMSLYWHEKYELKLTQAPAQLSSWHDDFHGGSMVNDKKRKASFVWLASEKPQGMLVPQNDSSLAEWRFNLSGKILGCGRDNGDDILNHREWMFEDGFLTSGSTVVWSENFMAEGQLRQNMARKHVAFAALPDESSVLVLQYARALNRSLVSVVKGINWNVPNDLFNNRSRQLICEEGSWYLSGGDYVKEHELLETGHWVNFDNKIGLCSLEPLVLNRSGYRQIEIKGRGKDSGTLYAEEICAPYRSRPKFYDRGQDIYRAAFALTLGDSEAIREMNASLTQPSGIPAPFQAVSVKGKDGRTYVLAANFGSEEAALSLEGCTDVCTGKPFVSAVLAPDDAVLLVK